MSPDELGELRARFVSLAGACGAREPNAARVFDEVIVPRHTEAHRRYHTLDHIHACLAVFDEFVAKKPVISVQDARIVELALWFHDLIYDPFRGDNEAASAAELATHMAGAPPDVLARAGAAILATRHAAEPEPGVESYVVDVDLSILGASTETFDAYEIAIREEYAFVVDDVFRQARGRVLEGFIKRPHIYATRELRDAFESRARANLARSLATLRAAERAAAKEAAATKDPRPN